MKVLAFKYLSPDQTAAAPPTGSPHVSDLCSLLSAGTSAQGSPLLASLPVATRPLQPQLDVKHLLPFRLNGSSPLSLFPNFNTVSLHQRESERITRFPRQEKKAGCMM